MAGRPALGGEEVARPQSPRSDAAGQDEFAEASAPGLSLSGRSIGRPRDAATSFFHDVWYDLTGRISGWEDSQIKCFEEIKGMVVDASKEQQSLMEASGQRQEELTRQLGDVARDIARHHALVSEILLRRAAHEEPGGSKQTETASQATMTSARLGAGAPGDDSAVTGEAPSMPPLRLSAEALVGSRAATAETALRVTPTPAQPAGGGAHHGSGAARVRGGVSPPAVTSAVLGKNARRGFGLQGEDHQCVSEATTERVDQRVDQRRPKLRRRSSWNSLEELNSVTRCASESVARTKEVLAEVYYSAYMSISEPERTGFLAALERKSTYFFNLVIFINTCWMTWFVNHRAQNPDDDLPWMFPIENVFLTIYLVELVLRIAVHRLYFFCNDEAGWNWLDFVIVLVDFVETLLAAGTSRGLGFVRVLRTLKVTRVFRVFRLVHFLKELRLIWDCLIGSCRSLFWSVAMMMLIMYMFSIVFVQGATTYLQEHVETDGPALRGDGYHGMDSREILIAKFGSMSSSVLSLFAAVTGGNDWIELYHAISPAGDSYSYLFLFFVAFCQISLLNIQLPSNALVLAQPTAEQKAVQKHNDEITLTKDLHKLVSPFDSLGSGRISVDKFFAEVVGTPLHFYLHSIDVSVRELKAFCEFIGADKRGTISVTSLVHGCTLVRGNARNLDMQRVLLDVKRMRREQAALTRALNVNVAAKLEDSNSTDSHPETPRSLQSEDC
ncbi:unnamed protein product [Prorocentrum cordatum]|uniref:Ion transport domain-containing protein n=1 Tax=Prorocentrum cordatum TaxID=2364126 RepID=A0ABN9WNV8_9DINO|nr:unnamed protein product [Polarella glacialis]